MATPAFLLLRMEEVSTSSASLLRRVELRGGRSTAMKQGSSMKPWLTIRCHQSSHPPATAQMRWRGTARAIMARPTSIG